MDTMRGLSNEETYKIFKFLDTTGITDMNTCREILIRHQWDLELALEEQMHICKSRPSMYAFLESQAPNVVDDKSLQRVFSSNMSGGRPSCNVVPRGNFQGIFTYVISLVLQYCCSKFSSVVSTLSRLVYAEEIIVTDPLKDVMKFIEMYSDEYPKHPIFYQGTYAQALNDAKNELRFLLVYLHKGIPESTYDVDTFCSQTLSDQRVIDYINRNVLLWGCDVSTPEGYRVSDLLKVRIYPMMVLIGQRNCEMIIMGRFEGDFSSEELLKRLQTVISDNEEWLSRARAERMDRRFTHYQYRQYGAYFRIRTPKVL